MNKKQLLVEAGFSPDITDELVENVWTRLQKFFKVDKASSEDKFVIDPKATEEKIVEGLKRWTLWEKTEKEKIASTKKK